MLYAFLKKGSFQDSVSLMLVSRDLSKADDLTRVSIMMGTPANKDVFRETGMWHEELVEAGPNDICVVIETETESPNIVATVQERMEEAFQKLAQGRKSSSVPVVHSFERAKAVLPDADISLISIAGMYADQPAKDALASGQHVMLFSDNVSVEREIELKKIGREKHLLVMGPDCGTSIISGAPLAFANKMPTGPIGIVGASGTGIQELCSQIALAGSGITHAIGLGGRDLSEAVGGLSAMTALEMLDRDPNTRVIAFVSKPPAPSVRQKIAHLMQSLSKPVVALFLGAYPEARQEGQVYYAYTLDEAARLALDLAKVEAIASSMPKLGERTILGLYSGGTLAAEAAMLLGNALQLPQDHEHKDGYMLHTEKCSVVDLGDDVYTRGRPHPMIDPTVRTDVLEEASEDVGVVMSDIVLGYGAHEDPAGAFVTGLQKARAKRRQPLVAIATVTGTQEDPQNRDEQIAKLVDADVIVLDSQQQVVMLVMRLLATQQVEQIAPKVLTRTPKIINIGLREFAEDLNKNKVDVVHYQWAPRCGGNERLQKLLDLMI